jgi:hypothetical protein
MQAKLDNVKLAYTKVVQDAHNLPIFGKHQTLPYTKTMFLESMNMFLRTSIHWIKRE